MNDKALNPVRSPEVAPSSGSLFASLQNEINRLFSDFGAGLPSLRQPLWTGLTTNSTLSPRMDVAETDKTIELTAELPGLQDKDIEVTLTDNVLTIRGEKKSEKDEENKDYHLVERRYGSFARRMELPAGIDPSKIEARFSNGVLTVTVAKIPPSVAQKIEVKQAA
ncbi:Hsp20/alpha crystallin family protein [Labrys sp. ZIDIC5]|uniref:Hsp20/alpha crystallin family protein n=1 Tax=Labrys sedimenti TaxID=3106036 RepID=UPI002ACAF801|nr:Hsp20/alpha crystallin family protein [Labrys sp. ZIDIC5]MDZ5454755.1 Hsp20/alpha crystallin family protein [Labrys sp. ZIDIC5]